MGLSKSAAKLKPQELKLTDTSGESHVLKVKAGQTLLQAAVDNSVDLPHSCGGMGTCGTCRVRLEVQRGPCPERLELESEVALERGYGEDERLSCQLEIPNEEFSWTAVALGCADEEW